MSGNYQMLPYEIIKHILSKLPIRQLVSSIYADIHPCVDEIINQYIENRLLSDLHTACLLLNSRYQKVVLQKLKDISDNFATRFISFGDEQFALYSSTLSDDEKMGFYLHIDFEYVEFINKYQRELRTQRGYNDSIYFSFNNKGSFCMATNTMFSTTSVHIMKYTHDNISNNIYNALTSGIDTLHCGYVVKIANMCIKRGFIYNKTEEVLVRFI